jgi:hypothetical protein
MEYGRAKGSWEALSEAERGAERSSVIKRA